MDAIVDFLHARIEEREQIAKAALVRGGSEWGIKHKHQDWWSGDADPELIVGGKPLAKFNEEYGGTLLAHHVRAASPQQVLEDLAAIRLVLNDLAGAQFTQRCHPEYEGNNGYVDALERVVRVLAAAYASHPDYDESWRP